MKGLLEKRLIWIFRALWCFRVFRVAASRVDLHSLGDPTALVMSSSSLTLGEILHMTDKTGIITHKHRN